MAKVKKLLSLDADTCERLEKYAKENHTSVSQAVTDWIWKQEVSDVNKDDKVVNANDRCRKA